MHYGFGIDIGGTKISMVLGTENGKILGERTIPTLKYRRIPESVNGLIENLSLLARDLKIPLKKIAGIGIGIPGAVDPSKGVVPDSPNLQGWKGYPLKSILEKKFRMPVRMTNDANAAVMGEKLFGQGRGKQHILYITISTGVGGGIIVNDRLLEGANFVAGEVGHMVIVPNGNHCNCGQNGCLEAYASGTAIAHFAESQIRAGRGASLKKYLGKSQSLTAREIGQAAGKRIPLALEAYRRAGFYLGVGVGGLLNILNPQIVILGGGVLKSAPRVFWQSMLSSAERHSWLQAFRSVRIVRTKLGDKSGNLGALSLVFMRP